MLALTSLFASVDLTFCFRCFNRYPSLHRSISQFPDSVFHLLVPSPMSSRVTFQGESRCCDIIPSDHHHFPASLYNPHSAQSPRNQTSRRTSASDVSHAPRAFVPACLCDYGRQQSAHQISRPRQTLIEMRQDRWRLPHIIATCGQNPPATARPAQTAAMTS